MALICMVELDLNLWRSVLTSKSYKRLNRETETLSVASVIFALTGQIVTIGAL